MRLVVLVGCALVVATVSSEAAVIYPWCARYLAHSAPRNCGFATFEQCRATVVGIGGTCQANPFYLAPLPAAVPRHSRRTRARRG